VIGPGARNQGLRPLCLVALPVLAAALSAQTAGPGSPSDSIEWLWQTPPHDARLDLRLTSVDAAGARQRIEATLRYARHGHVSSMTLVTTVKNRRASFCLRCDPADGLEACDSGAGAFPPVQSEPVPGTLLPWRAMFFGFCRQFRTAQIESLSDDTREVTGVFPLEVAGTPEGAALRVFVSRRDALPEKVVSVDEAGREQWTLAIHEVRKTKWGRAVTRSTYRDARTGARVLIEVRGGHVNQPPATPKPRDLPSLGPRTPSWGAYE